MSTIDTIMKMSPVIPVVIIDDIGHAEPLAEALVEGGLPCIEVTLRTPCAIDAIRRMRRVPGAIVGAGTVLNERHLTSVIDAGAAFVVSPGLTPMLGRAAIAAGVPFLPGIATSSDIMRGLDLGLTHFKFFPAEANGGLQALRAICAPFNSVQFCPTGGITASSARDWLDHPQVLCVGGSWMVPRDGFDAVQIVAAARKAAALGASDPTTGKHS